MTKELAKDIVCFALLVTARLILLAPIGFGFAAVWLDHGTSLHGKFGLSAAVSLGSLIYLSLAGAIVSDL